MKYSWPLNFTSLLMRKFIFNKYCKCIFSYDFLNTFFSLLYHMNIVYNTYNVQNMCYSLVYIINKASGPQ